jgi:hypothetical protein
MHDWDPALVLHVNMALEIWYQVLLGYFDLNFIILIGGAPTCQSSACAGHALHTAMNKVFDTGRRSDQSAKHDELTSMM